MLRVGSLLSIFTDSNTTLMASRDPAGLPREGSKPDTAILNLHCSSIGLLA